MASAGGAGDDASEVVGNSAREALDDARAGEQVDRADRQREDQEVAIGQSVRVSGYTATVTRATFQQALSDFEDGGYLVADVTVTNRDDRSQPYNTFDWNLQTPQGQVIDPTFTSQDQLGAGDLVEGGTVSGKVVWQIGAAKGQFFVVYKPDPFDAARGIWPVSVP